MLQWRVRRLRKTRIEIPSNVLARLFTSYYPESNPVRRSEILTCLERNLECDLLQEVCLLVEGKCSVPIESEKLLIRSVNKRPFYEDYFAWANDVTSVRDIAIVANSDICFDRTLLPLFSRLSEDLCAALSRWDVQSDGSARLFDRADSQDVWVFKGPVRPVVSNFHVGIPRCDNRILYELRAAGYRVINPSFSVKTLHLHSGERSEYPAVIDGPHVSPPYGYIWPANLLSLPETLWWNLRHPSAKIQWNFDQRRLESTLPIRVYRRLLRSCNWGSGIAR